MLVQARQIYTYSVPRFHRGALDAAQSAFEFTEAKYRHPAGGWRHRVTHEGAPLDDSRDLYDQAFVVFACAVLYRATGREDVLAAALRRCDVWRLRDRIRRAVLRRTYRVTAVH